MTNQKTQPDKIKLKLYIGDETQTSEGSTLSKAMYSLKKPSLITARGKLDLFKNGELISTFPLNIWRLRQLFGIKDTFKELFIKNLNNYLK